MDENQVHTTHNDSLATELLHEVKAQAKRWFIAFCVMVVLEVATIAGFLWYISLPSEVYEYSEQQMEEITGDNATQNMNTD